MFYILLDHYYSNMSCVKTGSRTKSIQESKRKRADHLVPVLMVDREVKGHLGIDLAHGYLGGLVLDGPPHGTAQVDFGLGVLDLH